MSRPVANPAFEPPPETMAAYEARPRLLLRARVFEA